MRTLAERREHAAKGGRAKYRKYGRLAYVAMNRASRKTRKPGAGRNRSFAEIVATPAGQREYERLLRLVGAAPGAAATGTTTGRGRAATLPGATSDHDSEAPGRRSSTAPDLDRGNHRVLDGDQLPGSEFASRLGGTAGEGPGSPPPLARATNKETRREGRASDEPQGG